MTGLKLKEALEKKLTDRPFIEFHGDLDQTQKTNYFEEFKTCDRGVMIATKSVAFGVNIPEIKQLIIYEIPDSM